jgi:hypothetical protein
MTHLREVTRERTATTWPGTYLWLNTVLGVGIRIVALEEPSNVVVVLFQNGSHRVRLRHTVEHPVIVTTTARGEERRGEERRGEERDHAHTHT